MKRELADAETPFTDFRVVDCEGLPKAVFDDLPPEQSLLLSHFLYPNKAYIGGLYLDALKISDGEIPWTSYEDDFLKTTFRLQGVLLESKEPLELTGSPARMEVSLGEVKFLLLKWAFECMRWGALHRAGEKS